MTESTKRRRRIFKNKKGSLKFESVENVKIKTFIFNICMREKYSKLRDRRWIYLCRNSTTHSAGVHWFSLLYTTDKKGRFKRLSPSVGNKEWQQKNENWWPIHTRPSSYPLCHQNADKRLYFSGDQEPDSRIHSWGSHFPASFQKIEPYRHIAFITKLKNLVL